MTYHWLLLWTDSLLYLLIATIITLLWRGYRRPHLQQALLAIIKRRSGMITLIILLTYLSIALLDSVHFRVTPDHNSSNTNNASALQQPVQSILDRLLAPLGQHYEKTYSQPFANHLFTKEAMTTPEGEVRHDYPPLEYGGNHLAQSTLTPTQDLVRITLWGMAYGLLATLFCALVITTVLAWETRQPWLTTGKLILSNKTRLPWRCALITIAIIACLATCALVLSQYYHILGTDKVGSDVFYQSIKSIRTGLLIGTLTTLVMLPFALLLGTVAGYFGGKLDDIIQYLYTTLSSIPGVLLIAAAILSLQVVISQHPEAFPTIEQRADMRLLALCIILGVTSWTGLCRVLRAETMKVRELDFVAAARSLGASHFRIMLKHILPNTMHIVIISVILDFSTLVLAEAVLSYIGIGVDPTTLSWGNMINAARLEMAREPIVWWPLLAAFILMFVLVLCANIFSDVVRDSFDPRLADEVR